jgi:hypothetical protein
MLWFILPKYSQLMKGQYFCHLMGKQNEIPQLFYHPFAGSNYSDIISSELLKDLALTPKVLLFDHRCLKLSVMKKMMPMVPVSTAYLANLMQLGWAVELELWGLPADYLTTGLPRGK